VEIFELLRNIARDVGQLLIALLWLGLQWWLLILWLAWWTFGVNWKKTWEVLARGAWAPLVLLMLVAALAWSQLEPATCECFGFLRVPNFWWQLGAVSLIVALTFLCGAIQAWFGWTPPEITFDPPAGTTDHGHGHGSDHHG
jgi:hypothetical protein